MLYVYGGIVVILTTVVAQNGVENKDVPSNVKNLHDDEAYRIAVGEKYFASLDNYNRDSWVDPYRMFSYDTETESEDPALQGGKSTESNGDLGLSGREKPAIKDQDNNSDPTGPPVCSKCNQNEYVYITRWLKKFLRKMNYNSDVKLNVVQVVQFSVGNGELHEISRFLDSKNLKDLQDLDSVFDDIVERFYILQQDSGIVADVFYYVWDNSTIVLTLLLCVLLLRYFIVFFHKSSWMTVCITIIVFVCFVSYIWTWIYMYQKEVAKQQAKLHSLGYPMECQPITFNFRSILKHFWKATFALEDVCEKYYEAQAINPFWKINPLAVLSETVSSFVLQPLGSIGSHGNIFVKNFYGDMSFFLMIPATFFLFIMLLMLFGYSLRLPFPYGSLEPSNQVRGLNKVELLPCVNTSGHEIAHDQNQSLVHSNPQHVSRHETVHDQIQSSEHCNRQPVLHSDFSSAGDHVQVVSYQNAQEQTTKAPLEVHELSRSISLKDQSSQTEEL